ncbi:MULTISPECIES: cyclic pyranopterin monophosphate synthase MoaC [unclassified Pseudoalteromonas]|uniref:cyclic pyranopterin monophosphate synthase MoaC n=1 Tax=unclassified Pseudoalteromonas TaxID=194690 RepID=UPI000CF724B3|nr:MULTISPECIES: cyclic pyranopterin monophosphate synthase MoaC [unclassified Pseudoalteromonas]MBS3798028.1 cyclic pyranopterin monophosphate synthase MoaC [Pseudoalteromonas sp. BDTF-M6]
MLTHLDDKGKAQMVDVSAKQATIRQAFAQARISMSREAFDLVCSHGHKKGDVIQVARIAGIQATKKCADLIPLCHPLALTQVTLDFEFEPEHASIRIIASAKLCGQTGVEMEALTGASVAALTIFDMCKAVDPAMRIGDLYVLEKSGGKSGHYHVEEKL